MESLELVQLRIGHIRLPGNVILADTLKTQNILITFVVGKTQLIGCVKFHARKTYELFAVCAKVWYEVNEFRKQ